MKEFICKLKDEKLKINWNKNPIPMNKFLSFLTVTTKRSHDHLGSDNGWTKLTADDGLVICGGVVGGIEYLDSLEYKKNLDNKYNNFINPFYMFDILNDEGKKFFVEYYSDDIRNQIVIANRDLQHAKEKVILLEQENIDRSNFYKSIGFID